MEINHAHDLSPANALPAYASWFGMTRAPFPVTPDDEHLFFTQAMRETFAEFLHFIELKRGFLLLTGEVGLGKTTLIRHLLGRLDAQHYHTAFLFSSFLDPDEILQSITADFGIKVRSRTRGAHLEALNLFLLDASQNGKTCVLVVDDAQALDSKALDVIRQLSNLETAAQKLIQIVLVAQPEIRDTLNAHHLRQLQSRIALQRDMRPMRQDELDAYLQYRMQLAGVTATFSIAPNALKELHQASGGIPRRVHHLMDRCLFAMVACQVRELNIAIVRQAQLEVGGKKTGRSSLQLRQAMRRLPWLLVPAALTAGVLALLPMTSTTPNTAAPTTEAAVAAPPVQEKDLRQEGWSRLLAAYPGLETMLPQHPESIAEVAAVLEHAKGAQRFIPVLLPVGAEKSCEGKPAWPIATTPGKSGSLVFIKASLPTEPISFGEVTTGVKHAQEMLAAKGWMPKQAVDGRMGATTAHAISLFQRARKMKGTGQFNPELVYALTCEARLTTTRR
jgi:general secretion pathway protein A